MGALLVPLDSHSPHLTSNSCFFHGARQVFADTGGQQASFMSPLQVLVPPLKEGSWGWTLIIGDLPLYLVKPAWAESTGPPCKADLSSALPLEANNCTTVCGAAVFDDSTVVGKMGSVCSLLRAPDGNLAFSEGTRPRSVGRMWGPSCVLQAYLHRDVALTRVPWQATT